MTTDLQFISPDKTFEYTTSGPEALTHAVQFRRYVISPITTTQACFSNINLY